MGKQTISTCGVLHGSVLRPLFFGTNLDATEICYYIISLAARTHLQL